MPANDKRAVKVQKLSGFDKHFRNTLTAHVGTLVPILFDELIPGSDVNLKINVATTLPPLVSDTYMNVRLRVEAFAVPIRLCQANYEDFFVDYPSRYVGSVSSPTTAVEYKGCMPLIRVATSSSDVNSYLASKAGPGSLLDYLGVPESLVGAGDTNYAIPVAPLVGYHLLFEHWYRNPRVQKPCFVRSSGSNLYAGTIRCPVVNLPYTSYFFDNNGGQPFCGLSSSDGVVDKNYFTLHDGASILDLRQRNFGLDFFTAAMVEPQQGDAAVVKFGDNGDPVDGFTIASLRAQNSIQQFRERNNLTSPRYQQQVYARYGCAPSDGVIQRPILIGAASYDVYSHGVSNNSQGLGANGTNQENSNYFKGILGSQAGAGYAAGQDFIIDSFKINEPCYLYVIASLVPEVSYSQMLNPAFMRYIGVGSISDMGNGILQNVGPEPILNEQVAAVDPTVAGNVFAYTDRYSTYMFKQNEIHGLFKHGENLEHFVSQRYFSDTPDFGSEFLEIPTTYLDDVMAVTSATLGFGYWLDCLMEYKVAMPLQEYAIPSLQDPGYEHGRTIVLRKNGQLL